MMGLHASRRHLNGASTPAILCTCRTRATSQGWNEIRVAAPRRMHLERSSAGSRDPRSAAGIAGEAGVSGVWLFSIAFVGRPVAGPLPATRPCERCRFDGTIPEGTRRFRAVSGVTDFRAEYASSGLLAYHETCLIFDARAARMRCRLLIKKGHLTCSWFMIHHIVRIIGLG